MKVKTIEQSLNEYGFVVHDVVGQSMLPLLKEGINKVQLVKPTELNLFDVVLYRGSNNNYVLHRIIDIDKNKLVILGDNNKFLEYKTKKDVLAKMTGYYEGTHFVDVSSKEYLDYLKDVYPFSDEENRKQVLNNPTQFFLNRIKEAYFSLMKFEITGSIDAKKINLLTPSEKYFFAEDMMHKKAIPHLALAIKSYGVDLGSALNEEIKKEANKLLNLCVREDIAINQLSDVFSKHNIKHIFLKGSETKKLYSNPELRTRNDIDVFVDKNDLEKAKNVIETEFNITSFNESTYDVSYMLPITNVHVELHYSIDIELPKDLRYLLKNPFEDAKQVGDSCRYVLSDTKLLLHSLCHSGKHLRNGWNWITMFLDVYYISKLNVDFEIIKKARLYKYFLTMSDYIEHAINDKPLTESESYFSNIWYKNSKDNSATLNRLNNQSKFKYYFKRLFMPYANLCTTYPTLKKVPVLYPYYLIKRIFIITFTKSRRNDAKAEFSSYNKANKEESLAIKEVGLEEYSSR